MRIIHITDLHYSKQKETRNDFRMIFETLRTSLMEVNEEKTIDLIFLTGDLIDKGGSSFKRNDYYKTIESKILKPILSDLRLTNDKLVILPGNHDVNENEAGNTYIKGLRLKPDMEQINGLISKYREKNGNFNKRLEKFKKFEKSFYVSSPNVSVTNFDTCFIYTFNDVKIGVASFNSAWSCITELDQKKETEKVLFGSSQILSAHEYLGSQKTNFNIALFHHPLDLINEEEQKELKGFLQHGNFSILFCGHTHKTSDKQVIEPFSSLYYVTTKSTFSDPRTQTDEYKAGYTIIDFENSDNQQLRVKRYFMKYFHPARFDRDTADAPKGMQDHSLAIKPVGKPFLNYLKKLNPSRDAERGPLFEQVTVATQTFLKSHFPQITDLAFRKLLKRLLPQKTYDHIRENLKVEFRISRYDDMHFKIVESLCYDLVSIDGGEIDFKAYTYIDKEMTNTDKGNIKFKKLKIGNRDYTNKISETTLKLSPNGSTERKRIIYSFSGILKGKKKYRVERVQESINSLRLNNIWKSDIINVYKGYEICVKNVDNFYRLGLLDISGDEYLSDENYEIGSSKKPIIVSKPDDVLVPGDCFLVLINMKAQSLSSKKSKTMKKKLINKGGGSGRK